MPGIKLFVDDSRKAPDGWVLARTVTEAIRKLATADVAEVSLDHDIACHTAYFDGASHHSIEHTSQETFEAVAWFILQMMISHNNAENCNTGRPHDFPVKVYIHTGNADASKKMADIMGIEWRPSFYPMDFRKDPHVKESWEGD